MEADWETILAKLYVNAKWRVQNLKWASGNTTDLAMGFTVDDVVQHTVERALSGAKNWDPERGPLLPWLIHQQKSVVNNLVQSAPNRRNQFLPSTEHKIDRIEAGAISQAFSPSLR